MFEWAKGINLFVGDNPARLDALKDHLPARPKVEHHRAMPYQDLPAFMSCLEKGDSLSAKALEFTILTAVRTQEAIGATMVGGRPTGGSLDNPRRSHESQARS